MSNSVNARSKRNQPKRNDSYSDTNCCKCIRQKRSRSESPSRSSYEDSCSYVESSLCVDDSHGDLYRTILGPSPEETILAGLQAVINMCSAIDHTMNKPRRSVSCPYPTSSAEECRCCACLKSSKKRGIDSSNSSLGRKRLSRTSTRTDKRKPSKVRRKPKESKSKSKSSSKQTVASRKSSSRARFPSNDSEQKCVNPRSCAYLKRRETPSKIPSQKKSSRISESVVPSRSKISSQKTSIGPSSSKISSKRSTASRGSVLQKVSSRKCSNASCTSKSQNAISKHVVSQKSIAGKVIQKDSSRRGRNTNSFASRRSQEIASVAPDERFVSRKSTSSAARVSHKPLSRKYTATSTDVRSTRTPSTVSKRQSSVARKSTGRSLGKSSSAKYASATRPSSSIFARPYSTSSLRSNVEKPYNESYASQQSLASQNFKSSRSVAEEAVTCPCKYRVLNMKARSRASQQKQSQSSVYSQKQHSRHSISQRLSGRSVNNSDNYRSVQNNKSYAASSNIIPKPASRANNYSQYSVIGGACNCASSQREVEQQTSKYTIGAQNSQRSAHSTREHQMQTSQPSAESMATSYTAHELSSESEDVVPPGIENGTQYSSRSVKKQLEDQTSSETTVTSLPDSASSSSTSTSVSDENDQEESSVEEEEELSAEMPEKQKAMFNEDDEVVEEEEDATEDEQEITKEEQQQESSSSSCCTCADVFTQTVVEQKNIGICTCGPSRKDRSVYTAKKPRKLITGNLCHD